MSQGDAAAPNFEAAVGTLSLGPIIETSGDNRGCGIGYETVGTISPSTYTGKVIIHRIVVSSAVYENTAYLGVVEPANYDDTSDPEYQDQDPQSGGSNGKVYDLDVPTLGAPDNNTYRLRVNFYTYAALANGTIISPYYYFYARLSCTTTTGTSVYQFGSDVSGDNQIGSGNTNISWNLQ